jgi:hypothetical protein
MFFIISWEESGRMVSMTSEDTAKPREVALCREYSLGRGVKRDEKEIKCKK